MASSIRKKLIYIPYEHYGLIQKVTVVSYVVDSTL